MQDEIVLQSFRSWSDVADLKFGLITSGQADITINMRWRGDGPGRVLAQAELPMGDDRPLRMWVDDRESNWDAAYPDPGMLLLNVVAHEAGHNIGLDHSRVNTALMAPYINRRIDKPQARDDIPRIQSIYGEPQTPTPPDPSVHKYLLRITGDVQSVQIHPLP